MSNRKKTRPARPHFERVTRKHAGGAEVLLPALRYWQYGPDYKVSNTKRKPGE